MTSIKKRAFAAALHTALAGTAPANAQVTPDAQHIQTSAGLAPNIASARRSAAGERTQPIPTVPQGKAPKSLKAAYYCNIEVTRSSMGKVASAEPKQFTILPLDDGSLVYGGNDPLNILRRFALVSEGEWRVMTAVGWIEGKEPYDPQGAAMFETNWSLTPRIHIGTGEFSAQTSSKKGPIVQTIDYSGKCVGSL